MIESESSRATPVAFRLTGNYPQKFSGETLDQLETPLEEFDPDLRPLVHRVLAEGGRRDPDATSDADCGRPELDIPSETDTPRRECRRSPR